MPQSWALSRDTPKLARALLGKFLVHRGPEGDVAGMITEVEAYQGEEDLACHARHGRTARNAIMYGPGGYWYVYLCYGIHEMLNLVTGPEGSPAAILVRGIEGVSGPGRVTRHLGINRRYQGAPCAPASGLWIEDRGERVPEPLIQAGPRIGIDYAGEKWAAMPWRFLYVPTSTQGKRKRAIRRSAESPPQR